MVPILVAVVFAMLIDVPDSSRRFNKGVARTSRKNASIRVHFLRQAILYLCHSMSENNFKNIIRSAKMKNNHAQLSSVVSVYLSIVEWR